MKKINYGGKVTIDNIRRSLSAFLSWLEALFVSLNKPHKFGRTMATRAIEQVQKILGHEQIDTTIRYYGKSK